MIAEKSIEAWSDGAGGAKALTGSFVGTQWFTSHRRAVLFDVVMASTGAPTSIEAQILVSPDGGVTELGPLDTENLISGGVSERQDLVIQQLDTADGHHCITVDGLIPGMSYCMQMKATGGTAPTALVYAYLGDV